MVLEMNGILYPIETKTKSNQNLKDVRGFTAFRECFPKERIHDGLLICSIEQPRRLADNVVAVP